MRLPVGMWATEEVGDAALGRYDHTSTNDVLADRHLEAPGPRERAGARERGAPLAGAGRLFWALCDSLSSGIIVRMKTTKTRIASLWP